MTESLPGGGAAAQIDQWVAAAKAKAERYQAMQAATSQVSVSESSPDGMISVTVDSAGNVTDLRITDGVRESTGAKVAAAVLSTLRRAQARLPERLGEVMAETIGDDQPTMDTIVGRYRAKFPEPEPEQPPEPPQHVRDIGGIADTPPQAPPPPPPRPPRPRPDEDDDEDGGFDGGSIMIRT
ncbi:YbaB/EbfC family nucleoid-associated protein [Amycolatopsis saalfeldensis]|uniref:YbaB/EbfC DNA-binding family protein n=1 Tax=Amycolatopsis saalfeldensis TaxID=394193 RepID=A0A1H8XHB1_9PSEU|nr:YbaB/EbfC family nucleoid-associated protein [Amycolatopsis saalfeldensis]SEP39242.1 YbaB/EbfC DNA-binding family protein [Amycolatopsis saalfeldensis]